MKDLDQKLIVSKGFLDWIGWEAGNKNHIQKYEN